MARFSAASLSVLPAQQWVRWSSIRDDRIQEILTDPSYCRQIVTLTYPHIGNTGVTSEDEESTGIQAAGLIIRDLPLLASNFRSEQSLSDYLIDGIRWRLPILIPGS